MKRNLPMGSPDFRSQHPTNALCLLRLEQEIPLLNPNTGSTVIQDSLSEFRSTLNII